MGGIRPYAPADAAQVLALHERTLPAQAAYSLDFLKALYDEVLFDHPWSDDELPSLVYERDDGSLLGFLGVVPRPMVFGGRRIRAAVSVRFMVDPSSRRGGLAATALHRRFLRGPQELSLIENANLAARRVWAGTPGVVAVPLSCISWTTTRTPEPAWDGVDRALDASELLDLIRTGAAPYALQPAYDERSLGWLLDYLEGARYRGDLRCRAVLDGRGGVRGWYAYYANPDGYNGVLAVRAAPGEADRTLRGLLGNAAFGGASTRTVGRLQADLLGPIADQGAELTAGPWVFAYSTDPRIAQALATGDAYFTRLDGEFC